MRSQVAFSFLFVCLVAGCAATVSQQDSAAARIHYDIAVASMNQSDMRAALKELLEAVRLDPTLAQAHNALGLTFHAMGRREDALTHYDEAVRLAPKLSEARNNRGVLLLDMGRYDQAVEDFEAALADILYATPSLAEGNLGWAYYKKGEVEQGLQHLRNAVATSPKFCRGYHWLATIEIEQKRPDQVVAYWKRFAKHCLEDATVAPTIPTAFALEMRHMHGLGLIALGERELARAELSRCVSEAGELEVGTKCAASLSGLE